MKVLCAFKQLSFMKELLQYFFECFSIRIDVIYSSIIIFQLVFCSLGML